MYTLIWSGRALDQLAEVYISLTLEDQRRLATGIDAFNQRLRTRPTDEGESRDGNLRIAFISGLAVRFRVDANARIVRVNNVRRYGR